MDLDPLAHLHRVASAPDTGVPLVLVLLACVRVLHDGWLRWWFSGHRDRRRVPRSGGSGE